MCIQNTDSVVYQFVGYKPCKTLFKLIEHNLIIGMTLCDVRLNIEFVQFEYLEKIIIYSVLLFIFETIQLCSV